MSSSARLPRVRMPGSQQVTAQEILESQAGPADLTRLDLLALLSHLPEEKARKALLVAIEMIYDPEPIDGLTFRHGRVLQALKAANGRLVTTKTLCIVAAPKIEQSMSANALYVIVREIRRLRPDIGARIKTAKGAGYRWVARPPEGPAA